MISSTESYELAQKLGVLTEEVQRLSQAGMPREEITLEAVLSMRRDDQASAAARDNERGARWSQGRSEWAAFDPSAPN